MINHRGTLKLASSKVDKVFCKKVVDHLCFTFILSVKVSTSVSLSLRSSFRIYHQIFNALFLLLYFIASTVSGKPVSTTGALQRSRSDVDVNAAANAKSRLTATPSNAPGHFSAAAALPPGSYASLGKD